MKEKIMKLLKSKLLFAGIVNAVFAALIILFTSFSYSGNADYYNSITICRDHFYYNPEINYILSAAIGTVQYSLSDFNCFVLFEILASYGAFVSITFVLADKYTKRKAFIFAAVLNVIYALSHYSEVTSESTAALMLLGGFMLILNAIYHKRYSLSCWVGVAEIMLGSFVNFVYFFAALGFAVAFYFGDMIAKKKYRLPFQKFFWYTRPFVLMFALVTVLALGFYNFSYSINHATPEAESYNAYITARNDVDALPFPGYKENKESFESMGIDSESKYELLKNGYYDPSKGLDTEVLQKVNEIQIKEIQSEPMYAFNSLFKDFWGHIIKPDVSFIAMLMYVAFSIMFIFFHKNRFSFFPLFYLLVGLITSFVLKVVFFQSSPVMYGALMFMHVMLMNSFNFEIQRSDKVYPKIKIKNGRMIISILAVSLVAVLNGFIFFSNQHIVNYDEDVSDSLISEINRNPDCYYVIDPASDKEFIQSTENYLHPLWGFREGYLENLDGFGYFHNDDMLRRRYLPENIYEAVLTNRKIFVIDKYIVFKKENYLTENYTDGTQFAEYEQVNELNGYKIYEVKLNNY